MQNLIVNILVGATGILVVGKFSIGCFCKVESLYRCNLFISRHLSIVEFGIYLLEFLFKKHLDNRPFCAHVVSYPVYEDERQILYSLGT